jgi:hypothetical protein
MFLQMIQRQSSVASFYFFYHVISVIQHKFFYQATVIKQTTRQRTFCFFHKIFIDVLQGWGNTVNNCQYLFILAKRTFC